MTDPTLTVLSESEQDTERLGRGLADALADGGVIALDGALGAGKTRLVQAIAAALGVDRHDVVSPTFVLIHEYQGRRPVVHIDAYRLRDTDEFLQLGADEYLAAGNLVLIEWAERVADALPKERLEIRIEILPGTTRRFIFKPHGTGPSAVVERLRTQSP
jgi:tRNA threonylcarbamoyladenosine biosynthesis protein TsaE